MGCVFSNTDLVPQGLSYGEITVCLLADAPGLSRDPRVPIGWCLGLCVCVVTERLRLQEPIGTPELSSEAHMGAGSDW